MSGKSGTNVDQKADGNTSSQKGKARIREVPAARRTVAILRLLSKAPEPLGVNAIGKKLGLIPSTCLHILRVLTSEGLVAVDPATKRYSLDVGILSLARNLMKGDQFIRLLQPQLDRISEKYNVSAIAVKVIDIEHSIVIALSHSASTMRLNVEIGSRFPTLISATGRCYAAFSGTSDEEIAGYYDKLRWNIKPDFREWKKQVEETKNKGYAVDYGNYIAGNMVVAMPIFDREEMTYSISVVGDATRLRTLEREVASEIRSLVESLGDG